MNCHFVLKDVETSLNHYQVRFRPASEYLKPNPIITMVSVHSTDPCRGQDGYAVT